MRITDAQVHLWEASRPDRPWPAGVESHLSEPMTAERIIPLMDAAGVDRAIIAPPAMAGFDPSYALECAARYPERFAVMGRFDPDDPAFFPRLAAWKERPGMLAIRLGLINPNWSRWRAERTLDPFWSGCERYDIPVAIFALHGLAGIEPIVQRHPGLRLIVDHLNLVGGGFEERAARLGDLVALAKYPNVAVKVSALPMYSPEQYPFSDLHGPIREAHAAFGAHRMMWGSDVSMMIGHGRATYRESVDLIRVAAAEFLPAQDIEWILDRTASEWLGWP